MKYHKNTHTRTLRLYEKLYKKANTFLMYQ